jgi:sucrose-6F-phosphate phosphohydrolase
MNKLLICTDLDRTLIPNGPQVESPLARSYFTQLCQSDKVQLAYVSGRDRNRIEQGMAEYDLPQPDFVIADVGSTLYRVRDSNTWEALSEWIALICQDWNGYTHGMLEQQFAHWSGLRLQESNKQNRFKLSFYLSLEEDCGKLQEMMQARLAELGIKANLIWSVDETTQTGLLDLLPQSAGKYYAINFLRHYLSYLENEVLFSGDSGNDLDVLVSSIPSVLVANATPEVKEQARFEVLEQGTQAAFYQAVGGFQGMNGCYSAGILEGVAHYHSALIAEWIDNLC